jgi:hypothetical protein
MTTSEFIAWLYERDWKICSNDDSGAWTPLVLRPGTLLAMYAARAAPISLRTEQPVDSGDKSP